MLASWISQPFSRVSEVMTWQPGDPSVVRYFCRGRPWSTRAATVVVDSPELIAFYVAVGMPTKLPWCDGASGYQEVRFAECDYSFRDVPTYSRSLDIRQQSKQSPKSFHTGYASSGAAATLRSLAENDNSAWNDLVVKWRNSAVALSVNDRKLLPTS